MKNLYKILHIISKIGSYMLSFSVLFLLQKYTIGYLFGLRNIVLFGKMYFYEILFAISSVLIIIRYVKISSPYEKYLTKC